jgi:hypothetical protein
MAFCVVVRDKRIVGMIFGFLLLGDQAPATFEGVFHKVLWE